MPPPGMPPPGMPPPPGMNQPPNMPPPGGMPPPNMGMMYYYNARTRESIWTKPENVKILKQDQIDAIAQTSRVSSNTTTTTAAQAAVAQGVKIKEEPKETSGEKADIKMEDKQEAKSEDGQATPKGEEDKQGSPEKPAAKPAVQKVVDKSRPVSSTPIPGTPWCVVWTGDRRVFFFNPSTRTSVWEKPADLQNKPEVDKMIQSPPKPKEKIEEDEDEESQEPPSKKPNAIILMQILTWCRLDEEEEEASGEDKSSTTQEEGTAAAGVISREATMEAELRASKERANVPLEVRMKQFREMLVEKEVSAFSTWKKELHKIVFDSRYLLLSSKERKQAFDKYVKERAEEERREKKNKMKERREDFRKLLESANLSSKTTYIEFYKKYSKDERFKNIEKPREREIMFNDFLQELRKREREERSLHKEKVKRDFLELLKEESKNLAKHSHWSDVKKQLHSDPRYKAVESSSQREDWFREFINKLPSYSDLTKKCPQENEAAEKERERQQRVEASLREREKEVQRTLSTHLRERDKGRELHRHNEAVQHFNALLTDLVRNADLSWKEAKRMLRKDHRWELIESLNREEREGLFLDHIDMLNKKKKEKFRELLDETPEIALTTPWKEVGVAGLRQVGELTLDVLQARKAIKDDPRFSKFSANDRKCEREYKEYLKDKMVVAKTDLRELLKETKIITYNWPSYLKVVPLSATWGRAQSALPRDIYTPEHFNEVLGELLTLGYGRSKKLIEESSQHLEDIEKVLQNDKRYLVLECIEDERRELVMAYIEDLDRRGPPPPPTASEPSRRIVK
ncbi:TCERG1 [Cordylochernes scorpioides]|uniref:TCERG1 n=1 Tax=Cordylochernes scorpioides TaxID=51811 RepID=A0ABY6LFK2_9ARAC|nr:TCERG1 [Cordylochernes scorpioides]